MTRSLGISLLVGVCIGFAGSASAEYANGHEPTTDNRYSAILTEAVGGGLPSDTTDDQGRPLVITAILYGTAFQLRQLLELGYSATADYNGISAVHFTVTEECLGEKLAVVIAAGGDVNKRDGILGATPLHYAAQHHDTTCLEKIFEAGAGINAQDKQGRTAYFYALDEDNAAAVSALWNAGADPDIPSADGLDLFKYAIASDKTDLVKPLVFKLLGADQS